MGNTQTRHEKNSSSNNSRSPQTKTASRSRSSAAASTLASGQGSAAEAVTAATVESGEGFLVRTVRDSSAPTPRKQQRNSGGGPSTSEPSARSRCCQRSSSTAIELQQARQLPQSAAQSQQQSTSQLSTWSLSSLSGGARLNWSFSAAVRNSFRHRNKSTRKSLTSLQGSRRSKTQWHRPLTNAIFSTHFKEVSRNDDFCIDLLVAKGAFGVVFKVSDKPHPSVSASSSLSKTAQTLSTCYALKVLKKSKLIEDNSVKQIKDEADIQRICGHHPFIVQQIDLWQNRYNLHILSEYVPNGELFSKIAYFSLDLVRLYLAEIALAIDFLHNAGIIYRDAKPENILLTHNFHIKLTDFGLSKWLKLGATTKTMCGTFKYMAPEILRGEAYGHAVDWWALGVIVCQMLTQKTPNIKRYLALTLVTPGTGNETSCDVLDNSGGLSRVPSIANINGCLVDRHENFLPREVEQLCHAARDVVQRLLELNALQRLRSVLALQRIALYKDFKVESQHLLSIAPLDIIARDQIHIFDDHVCEEASSMEATKAFQYF